MLTLMAYHTTLQQNRYSLVVLFYPLQIMARLLPQLPCDQTQQPEAKPIATITYTNLIQYA